MRGADKLLEVVEDTPLLRLVAQRARAVSDVVLVALPKGDTDRRAALVGVDVQIVEVVDPSEGMAASLRAGVAALPERAEALMILPADMPELDTSDLAAICQAYQRHSAPYPILRGAAEDGTAGHPVVFPQELFAELAQVSGDVGARDVVRKYAERVELVSLPDRHALTDLDTPEAWENWRAARGR